MANRRSNRALFKYVTRPRNPKLAPSPAEVPDSWTTRIRLANKAVLAAVLAGITGAITAGVVALPGLISTMMHPSEPLTVDGDSRPWATGPTPSNSAGLIPSGDENVDPPGSWGSCSLAGRYVLPEKRDFSGKTATKSLEALLRQAAYADGAAGKYILQAASGQTVVVTGIRTVVTERKIANPAMVINVQSPCVPCLKPDRDYHAHIDLDSEDPVPELSVGVPGGGQVCGTSRRERVNEITTVVTNDDPLVVRLSASTKKYDITWRVRIDYSVDGQTKSIWIGDDSRPLHAVATKGDDVTLAYRRDHWERI